MMIRSDTERFLLLAVLPVIAAACLAAPSSARGDTTQLEDRQALSRALLAGHVLDVNRQVVHLSHVCTLKVDGKRFPVVDLQELVPGAVVPRGVNRIVVLNDELKPVRTIGYTTERPLFCKDRRLFVFGDLAVDGLDPAGNVLVFSDHGRAVKVESMDVNQLPVPRTGSGKAALQ